MTESRRRPPRPAEWLMRQSLKSDLQRHGLVGDMREEYARRMRLSRRLVCDLWFWSQAILACLRFRSESLGVPTVMPWPVRGLGGGGSWGRDVRIAFRALKRRPLLVLVTTLTLGLGIGATTAIFNVIDVVLLERLPYDNPSELVNVWLANPEWQNHPLFGSFWDHLPPSGDEVRLWQEEASAFGGVAVHGLASMALNGAGDPQRVSVGIASADLFRVLGVEPAVGRGFLPGEDGATALRLAVLSNQMWSTRLGSDPAILGRQVSLDDEPFTVIGVLPPDFRLRSLVIGGEGDSGERALWIPAGLPSMGPGRVEVVARLAGDVSVEAAEAEAEALLQAREDQTGMGVRLVARKSDERGGYRAGLLMLFSAASLLLLVACTNVAMLMTGRALERTGELSTRVALGSGTWRLVRQLLTESVLQGLMGSVLGALIALSTGKLLVSFAPPIPGLENVGSRWTFLLFAIAVGLVTSVLFGLLPSMVAIRRSGRTFLGASQSHGTTGGPGVRSLLVSCEVALTVVLLVGSGLLIRSVNNLFSVETGFNASNVGTMEIKLSSRRYESSQDAVAFFKEVMERIRAAAGVAEAGGTSSLPLGSEFEVATPLYGLEVADLDRSEGDPPLEARGTVVLPGFHEVLEVPLLAGRTISVADHEDAMRVMVVNQSLARRLWPATSPLGREVTFDGRSWRIVGVVGDVKDVGLEADVLPLFNVPHAQAPQHNMTIVVKASGHVLDVLPAVREAIWGMDGRVPISNSGTMGSVVSRATIDHSYRTLLLASFAVAATIIAAAGVFGVTAHAVARRSRELGIRIALGSTPSGLTGSVMRQSLVVGLAGTICGLVAAFWGSRVLSGFLYGVESWDPMTYGLVALVGVCVCLLASYIPARRVSRLDPVGVLRVE